MKLRIHSSRLHLVTFVIAIYAVLFACSLTRAKAMGDSSDLLGVSGIRATYCLIDKKIPFKVENRSSEDLLIGISVEKRQPYGKWLEFCPDIHQQRSDTLSMRVFEFPCNTKKTFVWEPKKAGAYFALDPGYYRLIAYVRRRDEVPGRKVVIGTFSLIPCHQKHN